jgi:hypothetical protein
MKMEYTAEVLRGWPQDGGLDRQETVKVGSTLNNGDVVEMQTDGTVDKVSGTKNFAAGLVVRGNGDSTSVVAAGKCVVLWSNYIVRVKSTQVSGAVVVGSPVTAQSGKFQLATGVTDNVLGFCVKVQAATATEDAHFVIVVR